MKIIFLIFVIILILLNGSKANVGGAIGIDLVVTNSSENNQDEDNDEDLDEEDSEEEIDFDFESYVLDVNRNKKYAFTGEKVIFEIESKDIDSVKLEVDGKKIKCIQGRNEWRCELIVGDVLDEEKEVKIRLYKDDKLVKKIRESWKFNPEIRVEVLDDLDLKSGEIKTSDELDDVKVNNNILLNFFLDGNYIIAKLI